MGLIWRRGGVSGGFLGGSGIQAMLSFSSMEHMFLVDRYGSCGHWWKRHVHVEDPAFST